MQLWHVASFISRFQKAGDYLTMQVSLRPSCPRVTSRDPVDITMTAMQKGRPSILKGEFYSSHLDSGGF